MKSLLALALVTGSIFGQETKPAPKPPVLTDAQKLAYYKAALEYNAATSDMQKAAQIAEEKRKPLTEAVKGLADTCGKAFHPDMNPESGLVCAANTEPVKPAEAKK